MNSLPSTAAGSEPRSPAEDRKRDATYIRRRQIGNGLSGTVHKCLEVSTGNTYALKDLRVDEPYLNWRREVEIMETVSHVTCFPLLEGLLTLTLTFQ